MHAAVSGYFGGKLGPAPISEVSPRTILELGCGSGAWAIQAAKQFPDAQVLAVDVSPLPDRILPPNMRFQQADLSKEMNFAGQEAFDVVHARYVMCHIPNGKDAIERAARLVRPGGLLIMEDSDFTSLIESCTGSPALQRFLSTLNDAVSARGGDMDIGRKHESILKSLGTFEDVHVETLTVSLNGSSPNPAVNAMAEATRKPTAQMYTDMNARFRAAAGGGADDAIDFEKVLRESGFAATIYFAWARRTAQ